MAKQVVLDLMKPGIWNGFNITKDFIKQIANATQKRAYQNDLGPVVKGHPKHDDPAFGWWNKNNVKIAQNGHLQVQMNEDDFNSEFLTELKEKKYGPISIALRPEDLSLKHIGFFGGTTTAVTGLQPAFSEIDFSNKDVLLEFAECNVSDPLANEILIEFAEFTTSKYQLRSTENVFRNIKNFFISKFDLETADKVIPEHLLSDIKEPFRVWEVQPSNPIFNEFNSQNIKDEDKMSPDEIKALQAKAAKADQLEADLAKANESLQFKEAEERVNNALQFCETDEMRVKITPAIKNKVANTLAMLEVETEPILFSEDGKEVKVKAAEVFKEVLKMLPSMEFSEFVQNGKTLEQNSLIKEAQEMAKKVNEEL